MTLSIIHVAEISAPTILALVEDITSQRQLEAERKALLEQERRTRAEAVAYARDYEAIFEAITDSVTVYDTQGNILRMNHAARALLGVEHVVSTSIG